MSMLPLDVYAFATPPIDSTISVANLVAMFAVLVSIGALLVSTRKDRNLRKTQYADQIRNAAGILTAKLERWRDLAYGFFEEIQPGITDADIALVKDRDVIAIRDKFWRDLGVAHLAVSQRIRDEEIEIAYANLYGYDSKVRELFLTAIDRLQATREATHQYISAATQRDILEFHDAEASSARLGNRLRETCAQVAAAYAAEMDKIAGPFRREMIKLVEASDRDIAYKNVVLRDAEGLFPERSKELFQWNMQMVSSGGNLYCVQLLRSHFRKPPDIAAAETASQSENPADDAGHVES